MCVRISMKRNERIVILTGVAVAAFGAAAIAVDDSDAIMVDLIALRSRDGIT